VTFRAFIAKYYRYSIGARRRYKGIPMRLITLPALSMLVLTASCGAPGIKADTHGLGTSEIAGLLTQTWMNSPEWISSEISRMLEPQDGTGAPTVARATALGFDCGTALASCSYRGYVNYRLLNLPPENAARAVGKTSIAIRITQENPLVVHTDIDSTL
jgi:hypothetical protein